MLVTKQHLLSSTVLHWNQHWQKQWDKSEMCRSDVCAQNWLNVTNPLGEISPFISTAIVNIGYKSPNNELFKWTAGIFSTGWVSWINSVCQSCIPLANNKTLQAGTFHNKQVKVGPVNFSGTGMASRNCLLMSDMRTAAAVDLSWILNMMILFDFD